MGWPLVLGGRGLYWEVGLFCRVGIGGEGSLGTWPWHGGLLMRSADYVEPPPPIQLIPGQCIGQ